jgi:hypothetical protein
LLVSEDDQAFGRACPRGLGDQVLGAGDKRESTGLKCQLGAGEAALEDA